MHKILEEIIYSKKRTLADLSKGKKAISDRLRNPDKIIASIKEGNFFIAEIKRGSPSKGLFTGDMDIIRQAKNYIKGGANAISVLTESDHFYGSPEDLIKIREQFPDIPILRKDFITDEHEIYESADMGADMVLLIARLLKEKLSYFVKICIGAGIVPLVEIHSKNDVENALTASPPLIGMNTRDLDSFNLYMNLPLELLPEIPDSIPVIVESGISESSIKIYRGQKIAGFLIGESLIKNSDPKTALERIRSAWKGL